MAAKLGFREVKRRVLEALRTRDYSFEDRADADTKILLDSGGMTADRLYSILRSCRGEDHSVSPHHALPSVPVHVLKKDGWYVKFYFVEGIPSTMFISVHQ